MHTQARNNIALYKMAMPFLVESLSFIHLLYTKDNYDLCVNHIPYNTHSFMCDMSDPLLLIKSCVNIYYVHSISICPL